MLHVVSASQLLLAAIAGGCSTYDRGAMLKRGAQRRRYGARKLRSAAQKIANMNLRRDTLRFAPASIALWGLLVSSGIPAENPVADRAVAVARESVAAPPLAETRQELAETGRQQFAQAGARQLAPAASTDLTGCWEGYWKSCSTGHQGPLRAKFRCAGDAHYRVEFSGRFFKVFPFRYSVTLRIVAAGAEVRLAGSQQLPRIFGGVFRYDATATGCEFRAAYSSCKDHGVFCLRRVAACCAR
jgi:hypothetical protein